MQPSTFNGSVKKKIDFRVLAPNWLIVVERKTKTIAFHTKWIEPPFHVSHLIQYVGPRPTHRLGLETVYRFGRGLLVSAHLNALQMMRFPHAVV